MTTRAPFPLRRVAGRRRWDVATVPVTLATLVAGLWPQLVAWPVAGGLAVALAAGLCGWRLASLAAPHPHANDNARRYAAR